MGVEMMLRSGIILREEKLTFGAHVTEEREIPRCELVGGDREGGRAQP